MLLISRALLILARHRAVCACAYRKPRLAHYGSRWAHVTCVTQPLCILLISNVLLVLARHRMSLILKLFAYDIIFANHKDERLPPPGPAHSQRNPEQFVQGSQSTARSLRVQNQQLPTESQVFEDEVRPTTERTDQPAEEISERHDHGKNFSGKTESSFAPSHSFRRCTTFWRGTTTPSPAYF